MAVDSLARAMAAGKTPVDAYQMAVAGGYTGTKEEFEEEMGNSAANASNAAASAAEAAASAVTAANVNANMAPVYDSSSADGYAVGEYVLYNNALYECVSPVAPASAWDASKWEAVTVSGQLDDLGGKLTGLRSGKADAIHATAEGAIASFPDGADGEPMDSVVIGIDPVQDLHGYESPWPGGGGKNLLNNTATSQTVSNVAYTVNPDGTISTNGTSDGWNGLSLGQQTLKAGTYILSSGINSSHRYNQYLSATIEGNSVNTQQGDGTTFTVTGDVTFEIKLFTRPGYAPNQTVYPMIRLSSVSDGTYAPYSNVCPISGWTGAKVTRCGKNLANQANFSTEKPEYAIQNYWLGLSENQDGTYTLTRPLGWGGTGYVYVGTYNPGTYVFSANLIDKASVTCCCNIMFKKKNTWNNLETWTNSNLTSVGRFASPAKTLTEPFDVFVAIGPYTDNNAEVISGDYQLELGSTATAYEPYSGNTYAIDWEDEAGTVYGGSLDVTTGVLTVDRFLYVYDGTENFSKSSTALNGFYNNLSGSAARPHSWPAMIDYGAVVAISTETSSMFAVTRNVSEYRSNYGYCFLDSGMNFDAPPETFGTTIESFKAKLADLYSAGTPLSVFVKIATPITYQLTPTEVSTLLGTNNIWADTGDTAVGYVADTKLYIEQLTKPGDEDMTANANIASGKFFLVGNSLFYSTTAIAAGATIIPGTNCTAVSLADALNQLNT